MPMVSSLRMPVAARSVSAANAGQTTRVFATVNAPPVLISLQAPAYITFLRASESQQLSIQGVLSDGSSGDVTASSTFTSSDSTVVTVTDTGLVRPAADWSGCRAGGEGWNRIDDCDHGRTVAARPDLPDRAGAVCCDADDRRRHPRRRAIGIGDLHGFSVTFAAPDAGAHEERLTDYGGAASVLLARVSAPATFTITATVTNPANQQVYLDSKTVVVARCRRRRTEHIDVDGIDDPFRSRHQRKRGCGRPAGRFQTCPLDRRHSHDSTAIARREWGAAGARRGSRRDGAGRRDVRRVRD